MSCEILHGDCLDVLRTLPDDSVDLVITSPPYEDQRTYGIEFALKGDEYVAWAMERYLECVRVCRGLVVWVIEGKTKQFRYSATPILLMADLHRAGVKLRKPPIYYRVGIPGSGGPDWWRNDYEFCLASSKGKLPWSDNLATALPCKHPAGGAMSNRTKDGQRRNAKTGARLSHGRPKIDKANPGNVVPRKYTTSEVCRLLDRGTDHAHSDVLHCKVGGGLMGSPLAHENEAPFPEQLVEPLVLSFCPPGGTVLDPFCGSGTVPKLAVKHGRKAIGIDVRESQIDLTTRRLQEAA